MAAKPYLIFSLHDRRYAIAAARVTEIFLIPELIPIAEAPPDIVGMLNLHNRYVPVMHLDLRLGRRLDACHPTDSVIVVESDKLQVGVIVHQVETVINIDDRYIQDELDYGRERDLDSVFIQGIINLDDEMIILLDVNNLIRHPQALTNLGETEEDEAELEAVIADFYEAYFPSASSNVKDLLANRAINLKLSDDDDDIRDSLSIAIVGLNGGYFGIDLSLVREFTTINKVTEIPCCPNYIIGNMNLRGEILTLIDIRQPLNLILNDVRSQKNAIVVEFEETTIGIVVEEVVDVINLNPTELKPVPVAVDTNTTAYLKGIVDREDFSFNLIDLGKLLVEGKLTVELAA